MSWFVIVAVLGAIAAFWWWRSPLPLPGGPTNYKLEYLVCAVQHCIRKRHLDRAEAWATCDLGRTLEEFARVVAVMPNPSNMDDALNVAIDVSRRLHFMLDAWRVILSKRRGGTADFVRPMTPDEILLRMDLVPKHSSLHEEAIVQGQRSLLATRAVERAGHDASEEDVVRAAGDVFDAFILYGALAGERHVLKQFDSALQRL